MGMNQDELDRKLAERDELHRRSTDSGAEKAPGSSLPASDRFSVGGAAKALLEAVARQRPPAAEVEAAREQARADALVAHRTKVLAQRDALQFRIQSTLLAEIRKRPTPCALLLGPTGCGKTSAALWLRAGLPGEWFHAREIGECERKHALGEGDPQVLTRACSSRVLYIDDLGAEPITGVGVLQWVYERRYAANLATVTTTGLNKEMLTARYGAPTVRRMREQHVARASGGEWPVLVVDLHDGGVK